LLVLTLLADYRYTVTVMAQQAAEPSVSATCIHEACAARPVHFTVVKSVFARSEDHLFQLLQMTSLAGLAAQTYTNWTLIQLGDGLLPVGIARVFQALDASMLPRHKVLFQNMAAELREEHVYKGTLKYSAAAQSGVLQVSTL
jgi:hypothetical protein